MGLIDRITAATHAAAGAAMPELAQRAASGGPPGGFTTGTSWYGGPMFTDAYQSKRAPSPYQLVEAYKSLAYACVQINACAVTKIPLRLYADSTNAKKPSKISNPRSVSRGTLDHLRTLNYVRGLGSAKPDDVDEITNHPILECLDSPADAMEDGEKISYFSREELLSLICRYCDVVGACYLYPDGRGSFPPTHLWPLFSQYVLPTPKGGSPLIASYTYFSEQIPAGELIRFRLNPSLRDPYKAGYSPLSAAIGYLNLEDEYVAIQEQLLGNGPRPSLLVAPKDSMMPPGEPERVRLEQDLNRRHSRAGAGGAIVTNGAYDVKPITYSPTDISGMQLSEYDMERAANCFGVPIAMLVRESNLANLEAANVQHARGAVEPRCRMIAAVLTRLVQKYDRRLFFAFDPAIPEDEERKAKIVDMRLKSGQITINEANEELPYPRKKWGDEPWIAGTLVQPTMATEKHEQGMESAKLGAEGLKAEIAQVGKEGDDDGDGEDKGKGEKPQKDEGDDARSRAVDAMLSAIERSLKISADHRS